MRTCSKFLKMMEDKEISGFASSGIRVAPVCDRHQPGCWRTIARTTIPVPGPAWFFLQFFGAFLLFFFFVLGLNPCQADQVFVIPQADQCHALGIAAQG